MRLMLTSHSNIAITRRTYMWTKYYNKFGDLKQGENFDICLRAMLESKSIIFLQLDEQAIRSEFWNAEPTYPRLFAIMQMQFASKMGKSRWGDQMGMIESFADPIFAAYPRGKIIHMIRDPRERFLDKFPKNNAKHGKFGWETERWLKSIKIAQRNLKRFPQNYKVVRYEKLMDNPENTMREMCDFIAEPYEPGMITMENAIRFGDKPLEKKDLFLKKPPNNSSINKNDVMLLSNFDVAYVQSKASSEMLSHGYALENVSFSISDRIKYIFFYWPINFAYGLAYIYSGRDTLKFLPKLNILAPAVGEL